MTDLTLNDGRTMPQLGFGTWQIPDAQAAMVVRAAIDAGYRLIDTAAIYHNEAGVGGGVAGDDVWVTTKLWNDRHSDPEAALDESLALLGRDSVDLYLIHWPVPSANDHVATWEALVRLREKGKTRSIGVSNFLPEHIDAIVEATGVMPVVNQIELHPGFQQRELAAYNKDKGIITQSWSPLGQGGGLADPAIARIAERLDATPAQVVIAWHLQHGFSVIPKSGSIAHLIENLGAQDLTLSDDDMAAIDALDDADGRLGEDPREM